MRTEAIQRRPRALNREVLPWNKELFYLKSLRYTVELYLFLILPSPALPCPPGWGHPDASNAWNTCMWKHYYEDGEIPEQCRFPCLWHHSSPCTGDIRSAADKLENLSNFKRDKAWSGGDQEALHPEGTPSSANWAGSKSKGVRRTEERAEIPRPYPQETLKGSCPPGCFVFWLFFIHDLKKRGESILLWRGQTSKLLFCFLLDLRARD